MDNTENYTYKKEDLVNSIQIIEYPKGNTDKNSSINNMAAPLQNCCNGNVIGLISFTNNVTSIDNFSFTTATGTIITPRGTLVVNFHINNTRFGLLSNNVTIKSKPTFKSGLYEQYENIVVTIVTFDDNNTTRIVNISY
jgi:hypothetical protein